MRAETKKSLDRITDVLAGDEGGVPFVYFLNFLREFDGRAAKGDKDAQKLIDIVHQFRKMIDYAQPKKT